MRPLPLKRPLGVHRTASSTWTNPRTRRRTKSWRGSSACSAWRRPATAARSTRKSPEACRVHRPRDAAGQGAAGRGEGVRLRRACSRRQSGKAAVQRAIETLTGALFQRPPLISAVKRQLRIRTIYESKMYSTTRNATWWCFGSRARRARTCGPCACTSGCSSAWAAMQELRRVRSNLQPGRERQPRHMHDVMDAMWTRQFEAGGVSATGCHAFGSAAHQLQARRRQRQRGAPSGTAN